jgi:hypothetical protein
MVEERYAYPFAELISMSQYKTCPGCGLRLPDRHLDAAERYRASGECRELYHELSAWLMMNQDLGFRAQHAVDAYGAQHSGGVTKNITTAFALIGLYLALEKGFSGRRVQQIHMELARMSIEWPSLEPPAANYAITVADVVRAEEGPAREEMLMEWARCAWDAWRERHDWVRSVCAAHLRLD